MIREWIDRHQARNDELVWVIEDMDGRCLGHVGLYQIDYRAGSAEFGIMIGDAASRGRGIGRECTIHVTDYAFRDLRLNRVSLTVLATNVIARELYRSIGYQTEGVLRQAQFRNGRFVDVILMAQIAASRPTLDDEGDAHTRC